MALKFELLSKATRILHKPLNHFVRLVPFCMFQSTLYLNSFRQLISPHSLPRLCAGMLFSACRIPILSPWHFLNATYGTFSDVQIPLTLYKLWGPDFSPSDIHYDDLFKSISSIGLRIYSLRAVTMLLLIFM